MPALAEPSAHRFRNLSPNKKLTIKTKSRNMLSPTHFFCFPCHSAGFILARSQSSSYHSIFPLPIRKGNKDKNILLRRYPHAAGAIGETPATEVEMKCLPWTEPAGIAGRAAEQCANTSKAENHWVKFEDKNASPSSAWRRMSLLWILACNLMRSWCLEINSLYRETSFL